jgi:PKD repeat protein
MDHGIVVAVRGVATLLILCAIVLAGAAMPERAGAAAGPPIARFTCAASGLVCDPCPEHCTSPKGMVGPGVVVRFDGRPSSDDRDPSAAGTVVAWEWAFGDGATATGAQVEHAFVHPGTYPVTLKAIDDDNQVDTKIMSIVVAALPTSMAALGDSYSAGAFTGAPCDPESNSCAANSWSTGTTTGIDSHYQRLLALEPRIAGANVTNAVSARRIADLDAQAKQAVAQRAQYVTIMLGLNDYCRETEATMTSVAAFRSSLEAGMTTLTQGLPNSRILVASIFDAEQLRTLHMNDEQARAAWSSRGVCPVVLANPQSTAAADVERRQRARQRVIAFNTQLAQVCALHVNCRYDGGAVFGWQPQAGDFVTRDYFHPSRTGQARLSAITWEAGIQFGTPPPPPPPGTGYAEAVLADGPVGYWRLGETAGTVAANAVPGGVAGRYSGGYTLGALGAIAGDGDRAVKLGGVDGYVSVPHASSLNTADNFTLEAWVKRAKINTTQGLFAKGNPSYQVYIDAANKLVLRQTGIADIVRSTTALTDLSAFHHLAITKNGPTVRLYIDGADRTGTVANRTLSNTTSSIALGSGSGSLNGTLDDVAIYPRALDAATIANHHALGTPPPA